MNARDRAMNALPPGPSNRLLTTWAVMTKPYAFYREQTARYGVTFSARAMNGDLLITGDPELVKQIFALTEDDVKQFAVDVLAPMVGSGSVLLTHGEPHRRSRRLLMPPFHGERMRAYRERMRAIALEHCQRWPERGWFKLHDAMLQISLQIIVETIFGARDAEEVARYTARVEQVIALLHPAMLFSKVLQVRLAGLTPWDAFLRARDAVRTELKEVLKQRREASDFGTDILSMLLQARDEDGNPMDDDDLIDQLLTLLVAGHETTSIAMSWAVYWLAQSSEERSRVLAELDGAGDYATSDPSQLPVLDTVVRETLRLWPIVPDVLRTARRDLQIGEWTVPAGMSLAAIPAITHYLPEIYPEPDSFKPSRFDGFSPRSWEYYPFGGGIRRCIGAAFAQDEMAQVLAVVLRTVEFERDSNEPLPAVRRNVTMAPKGGVRVRCKLRAAG